MSQSRANLIPSEVSKIDLVQKAFGARNALNQRSVGRKMSTDVTVNQMITSLPGNADGFMRAVLKGMTATNIVSNGNFASTTGWVSYYSTISASSNMLSVTGNGSGLNPCTFQDTSAPIVVGNRYYIRCLAMVTNSDATSIRIGILGNFDGSEVVAQLVNTPTINQWHKLSGVVIAPTGSTGKVRVIPLSAYADAATASGKVMQIKQVLTIDLTAMFGAGNEPDASTCDKMFANWFDGTKSVQSQRVKSVGKNLFGGTVGVAGADTTRAMTTYILVKAAQYIISIPSGYTVNSILVYDINRTLLSTTTNPLVTFPTGAAYCRIIFYKGSGSDVMGIADYAALQNGVQIELGATATTYEPYTETVAYVPGPFRSAGTVKDETNIANKQKKQRISGAYTLQASNIASLYTSFTNYDIVRTVDNLGFTDIAKSAGAVLYNSRLELFTYYQTDTDNTFYIGTWREQGTSGIGLRVPKGTYADLAAAQAALAGTQIVYQLATPVISYYKDLGQLDALPSGSIIIEPIVRGVKLPAFGTGKINVTTADAPISSIESIYRIDTNADGSQVKVDVTSSFTVDADKLGITYASADSTKPYEYVCTIDPAYSTIPSLTYSYPEADALALGIASHSYASAAADWVMTTAEGQCGVLVCTLASGSANIIAPDRKGTPYWVQNDSGQTLTIKKSGGTGDTVANTKKALFIHTGTDYVKFFTT